MAHAGHQPDSPEVCAAVRHACVSTWLKAGTEPKRVAEWAGHSVDVLLRIYTHCFDGGGQEARQRIQRTLEQG